MQHSGGWSLVAGSWSLVAGRWWLVAAANGLWLAERRSQQPV